MTENRQQEPTDPTPDLDDADLEGVEGGATALSACGTNPCWG